MADRFVLTNYQIKNAPVELKIAHVSDLHERGGREILRMLDQVSPDVIVITGDTFERYGRGKHPLYGEDAHFLAYMLHKILLVMDKFTGMFCRHEEISSEMAYAFLREASQKAPVFMSLGNHEWYLRKRDREVLQECGITLLDNADTAIGIRGQEIHIGGLSSGADCDWLKRYAAKEGYKILLCHHPEYYKKYIQNIERQNGKDGIDLVLSGHAHGGQWRMGKYRIYAPGQGLLPEYVHGIYDGRLVVSAGCANTASVPRFGNPCELVVVTCQCEFVSQFY